MSESVQIERLSPEPFRAQRPTDQQQAWQRYAHEYPAMNLYHSLQWRDLLVDVFGLRPRLYLARRKGEVTGLLPTYEVRFPLLGSKFVSLPYEAGSGGPLADDDESSRALVSTMVEDARSAGAQHVEVRSVEPSPVLEELGFTVESSVFHSEVDLSDGEEAWKRVGRDQRGKMRKAARSGVTVRQGRSAVDYEAYYQVYLRSFHAFGTPPYGKRYYPTVHERFDASGESNLFLAEAEGQTVGGYLLFKWGTRAVNKISCVLPEALRLGVFPALYGHVFEWCIANGVTWLSYGTSAPDDQGLVDYKERWAATTHRVQRCTLALKGSVTPLEDYYKPDTLPKRAWKRLPRAVTPFLGHVLNRWFA